MDTDGFFHDTERLGIETGRHSPNQYIIREYTLMSWRPMVMGVGRPVHYNRL
jgi:hypothetical protein